MPFLIGQVPVLVAVILVLLLARWRSVARLRVVEEAVEDVVAEPAAPPQSGQGTPGAR